MLNFQMNKNTSIEHLMFSPYEKEQFQPIDIFAFKMRQKPIVMNIRILRKILNHFFGGENVIIQSKSPC